MPVFYLQGRFSKLLKQFPKEKSGKGFLSAVKQHKHQECASSKTKAMLFIAYLEGLRKNADPTAHDNAMAGKMALKANNLERTATIHDQPSVRAEKDTAQRRNIGFLHDHIRAHFLYSLLRFS